MRARVTYTVTVISFVFRLLKHINKKLFLTTVNVQLCVFMME